MSKVNVQTVANREDRSLPIFAEIDKLFDQVREEAYKRFQVRGFASGSDLDDWLGAERELCRPDAELKDVGDGFRLDVALAGFEPEEIELTATPGALIVKATHESTKSESDETDGKAEKVCWSEFRHNDVYRYVSLPEDVDADKGEGRIEARPAEDRCAEGQNLGQEVEERQDFDCCLTVCRTPYSGAPGSCMQASGPEPGLCFRSEQLTKVYGAGHGAVQALRGVDLALPERELVVLLGASGSGKSTLLNILGGLDRPTSGRLWFRGTELTSATQRELTLYRRQHVGFVFQFYNLMASLTARENVALVTEIAANPLSPEEALTVVGLESRLDHFPSQLSGGEQQRVAIARAIAKQPSVLLCDEPTGALDSTTGVRVLEALRDVNERMQATTLLITHNAAVADMADRVITFSDGRVREERQNAARRDPREISW